MRGVSAQDNLVKGTPAIFSREWLDEHLGAGWFHATISAKHPDWPERLLPGDYYPLRPQMHAWRQALGKIDGYESVETMVQQAAAATAEHDLNSIYKAFLWAAKPKTFLIAVPRLWASYVRFGKLETVENVVGCYRATITGVPEGLLEWSAGSVAGFLRPALLLAGGTQPDSQVTDRRHDTAEGTWDFDYQLRYQ